MSKSNYKKRNYCIHGIKDCKICAANKYYLEKDAEAYKKMYDKKKITSYEIAFALFRGFNRWSRINKIGSIYAYLKELKNHPWSFETLKQAYYLARCFPDLHNRL